MKKALSLVLAMLIILSSVSMGVMAQEEEKVPLVILQGYSGPNLAYADENGDPIFDEEGNVQLAWPLNFDALGEDIAALLADVTLNQADLTDELAKKIKEYLSPIGMNPDGTSKNNLVPYPSGAAATRASTLIENGMEQYIPEEVVAGMAMEEIGAENIFGFTFDWRKSQVDYAEALDKYIQEVKDITGSDKVDIYGLSHGGQYGTTYLYLYGDKGDVRRAMFGNPATLGTTLCGSIFTGEYMDVPLDEIVAFIEHGFEYEKNWEWIFELYSAETIISGANDVIYDPELWAGITAIPSLWDFVPFNYFEEALNYTGLNLIDNKKLYVDTVAYHSMISNGSDNLADKLAELTADGMQIGYVVGNGYTSPNGKYNSDILIDTYLSSGSDCALVNERFANDYEQANTVCDNPNHYHISPEFDIDASTGFLPDSTWYVRNQGHGMIMHDEYSKNLVHDFLWGDIKNVYSSKEYPQFNMSQNNSEITYMRFNNTSPGYHSQDDNAIVLKNMSVEADIVVWSIEAVGADITFKYAQGMTVGKGKVVQIEAINNLFANAEKPFAIEITYSLLNIQGTFTTDTFMFTPLSTGDTVKYPHLLRVNTVVEDEEITQETPEESTTETTQPESTTEKKEETTTEKTENVQAESNPKTDRQVISLAAVAVVFGTVAITAGAIAKRKDEE